MISENNIPKNWIQTTLGKVSKVQTGPFGSQLKNEQYITGGTPVVTVEHIKDFRIKDFNYPSVTNEDRDRLSKYLLRKGDIIFTRVGSVDLSSYVDEKQDGWMFSSRMLSVRTNDEVDSKFLSYYFRQNGFRKYIYKISVGATMPSINTSILKSVTISYPSIKEQKIIAKILTVFDDKINLLEQQNSTLETIAKTIFKDWFGRYQLDDELPEGWRVEKLGELCLIEKGLSYKGKHIVNKGVPMVNLGSVLPGGGYRENKIKFYDGDFRERHIAKPGDIIIANTDMTYDRVILGSPFIIPNSLGSKIIFTHHLFCLKTSDNLKAFIFYYLKGSQFREMAESCVTGTTVLALPKKDVVNFGVILPSNEVLKKFNNILQPILTKLEYNKSQIQSLAETRDTLLPKLMSGQVRVKNIEK
jgi:type I restriction enzyme S subunit